MAKFLFFYILLPFFVFSMDRPDNQQVRRVSLKSKEDWKRVLLQCSVGQLSKILDKGYQLQLDEKILDQIAKECAKKYPQPGKYPQSIEDTIDFTQPFAEKILIYYYLQHGEHRVAGHILRISYEQLKKYHRMWFVLDCPLSRFWNKADLQIFFEQEISLKNLSLVSAGLTVAPDLIKVRSLTELDLSYNQLEEPPDTTNLVHLKKICLYKNCLKTPPNTRNLTNLVSLDLSHNNLEYGPDTMRLNKLQIMNLSFNKLRLPPDTTHLVKLQMLCLGYNKLTKPPILDNLHNLQELYLHNNQIRRAPNLQQLTQLVNLTIDYYDMSVGQRKYLKRFDHIMRN